ncbi:MAG: phospholipase D-like domain-containing protein [Polyangia bacterium]
MNLRLSVAPFVIAMAACSGSHGNADGGGTSHDLAGADLTGVTTVDGGLPPLQTTSEVTVVIEPEDKGATLLAAIKNATTSIHMTMYLLTDAATITALKTQHTAGHDIKVLLNQNFPPGQGSQTDVYNQLQAAGVSVKWAPNMYQYTHAKTLVIDGKTALIMTMNASSSAYTGNREYLGVDTDAADVAEAEAIFQADWSGMPTATTGKLVTAPDNAEVRLVQLVDMATATVDLEGEVFSSSAMLNALGRANKRGVAVRLLLADETPTTAQTQAIVGLKQVGIPVRTLSSPDIHAKAIVVDGKLAYIGSENFTANSLENNRELGLIVSAPTEVQKVASTIAADFAAGVAQ